MNYFVHLGILVGIYVILAQSLNLVSGYAGLVSLAHATFYGIGAYATALLMVDGWGFAPALLAGVLLSAAASLAVSLPLLRLTGDYVVLCTLGAQVVGSGLFYNWTTLTGGPVGIVGIPRPRLFGWTVESGLDYLLLTGMACAVCLAVVYGLTHAPFGRSLRAMRDDQRAAEALGKNTRALRITAFAIGAALAAGAGALYASYARFVDPTSFTLGESIFVLAIVIVGGAGTFRGPIIGAATLLLLPELFAALAIGATTAAHLQQIAYGASMVLLMRWRPTGLAGEYGFR